MRAGASSPRVRVKDKPLGEEARERCSAPERILARASLPDNGARGGQGGAAGEGREHPQGVCLALGGLGLGRFAQVLCNANTSSSASS